MISFKDHRLIYLISRHINTNIMSWRAGDESRCARGSSASCEIMRNYVSLRAETFIIAIKYEQFYLFI